MKRTSFAKLSRPNQELLEAARVAMESAYNPYSNFFVGAALRATSGEVITGSNFENASYSVTVCAERSAIVRASAMGHKTFSRIAVIGRGQKSSSKSIVSPCGVCRQVLMESAQLSNKNIEVIMSSSDMRSVVVATIRELLPLGFGPHNLGLDLRRFKR